MRFEADAARLLRARQPDPGELQRVDREALDLLQAGLEQRHASVTRRMLIELGVALLGVLLMVYGGISFYLSFSGAFRAPSDRRGQGGRRPARASRGDQGVATSWPTSAPCSRP